MKSNNFYPPKINLKFAFLFVLTVLTVYVLSKSIFVCFEVMITLVKFISALNAEDSKTLSLGLSHLCLIDISSLSVGLFVCLVLNDASILVGH